MGWWIALAVLVGLAILPLGVSFRYRAEGILLNILAGPIRIRILPAKKRKPKKDKPEKKKRQKPKKKKDPQVKKAPKAPAPIPKPDPAQPLGEKYPDLDKKPGRIPRKPPEPEKPEAGGSWKDFLTLVPIALDFLGDFRRKLRVDHLELRLVMAGNDPCDLAVNYGKAWAALGTVMSRLERVLVIRRRDVKVECDFLASDTKVTARVDLTITLGRLLAAVCKFGFRTLAEYLKIMKKRKGGAAK